MRSKRNVLLAGLGSLIVAAAGLTYAYFGRAIPPPPFPKGTHLSVAITLENIPDTQPAVRVTSTDPDKIEALSAVLRRARSTPDHKCGGVGGIRFRSRDGSETVLELLPGHDPRYFEYRAYHDQTYDNFRVGRDAFLKAMTGLGVTRIALHD